MSWFILKTVAEIFGSVFSMFISLFDILSARGLLPFSGVILTEAFSKSMSIHLSLHASPHLIPVSFRSCRKVAVLLVQLSKKGKWSIC